MPVTAWLRRNRAEALWVLFAAANVGAMIVWPSWETIPFHFVWISLTLLYGFRVWSPRVTTLILSAVALTTGGSILVDAFEGIQLWGELFEVPLMAAMFLAMVWHARRRVVAIRESQLLAESRAALLARQERFLHDVSHELRTPVTIARGHLELLGNDIRESAGARGRPRRARTHRPDHQPPAAARQGRPAGLPGHERAGRRGLSRGRLRALVRGRAARLAARRNRPGRLWADEEALRVALDALLENAVEYTEPERNDRAPGEGRRRRARGRGGRRRLRHSAGGARPHLRTLRPGRRRAVENDRRCGPRPVDRRRDREGARRDVHGRAAAARDGLRPQAAEVPALCGADAHATAGRGSAGSRGHVMVSDSGLTVEAAGVSKVTTTTPLLPCVPTVALITALT